jgi:DNA-binding GntR family transcriptional regulator
VWYSAIALAEKLHVSATPVREAMMDLASAGLIEAFRNRGYQVRTVSEDDLDEIVRLRTWLEVPAIDDIADRDSDIELEALVPLAETIVRHAERNDVTQFLLADRIFHRQLLTLAGSPRLVKLVMDLRGQTQLRALADLGAAGRLDHSVREHLDIVAALRDRDGDRAKTLMKRHLQHARGIWAGFSETD